jgi:hypothetical protein
MCKPVDRITMRTPRTLTWRGLGWALGLGLLPAFGSAAIAETEPPTEAPAAVLQGEIATSADASTHANTPATPTTTAAPGLFHLRCWQHGRLLFEETRVSLRASGAIYNIRITGSDRHQQPLYVAETQNATCLIRQEPPQKRWQP